MKIILFIVLYCVLLVVIAFPSRTEATTKVTQLSKMSEFERIGYCESKGNKQAKNKKSTASGEYQFTWGSWHYYGLKYWGEDFYDKNIWSEDNRILAEWVYETYGSKPWESSKRCWSKTT